MAKYLLLKHYRGGPKGVNDVPMDQWTPEEVDAHMQYMKKDADSLIAGNKLGAPFDYKGYVYPDLLREVDPKAVTYTKLP